jgi:nicotinamide-nucleotide amidase
MLTAEVISIGDELTSGQRLDTNSQWLSLELAALGVRTLYHTTVGDELAANVRVFREAVARADLVIATGGLGPTADDLTRQALAEAAGRDLVLDPPSLAHIEALFARRRGRPMPESNRVQAWFPWGSRIIPNPHGTAPGIDLDVPRLDQTAGAAAARVFCLPGVPAEMKEMWRASIVPAIEQMLGHERRVIAHHCVRCFGVGESDLEAMLPDMIRRGRTPSIGITVSGATITLRITAEGKNAAECRAAIEPDVATIRKCLGTLAYGEAEDELHEVVLRMLRERGQTLATAEGGTGGMVSHWLAADASFAEQYRGGIVAAKAADLCRLASAAPAHQDAVWNDADAAALAGELRVKMEADWALVVSPFPPNAADGTRPACWLALAGPGGTRVKQASLAAHPEIVLPRAAKTALDMLRRALLGAE